MLVLAGLYLLAMGFLLGTINERILFDRRRDAVLRPYEEALTQWHATLMARQAEDRDLADVSTWRDSSGGLDDKQNRRSTASRPRDADPRAPPPPRRGSWED